MLETKSENDLTDISVDYERTNKFFDEKRVRKFKILRSIGYGILIVGVVMFALASFARMWSLRMPGIVLALVGFVMLLLILPKVIKESEITDILDMRAKQFKEYCEEKIEYPSDRDTMAMMLMGCEATAQTTSSMRKLKSGNYFSPDIRMTYMYINSEKKYVFVGQYNYSLIKPEWEHKVMQFDFDDIDKAVIVPEKLSESITINRFSLLKGEETVFSTPLTDNDYYKEEFAKLIGHTVERASRRQAR